MANMKMTTISKNDKLPKRYNKKRVIKLKRK